MVYISLRLIYYIADFPLGNRFTQMKLTFSLKGYNGITYLFYQYNFLKILQIRKFRTQHMTSSRHLKLVLESIETDFGCLEDVMC